MPTHILAIDQGTTSTRSIVFDGQLRIVAQAQREFTQHLPRSGWVEHDFFFVHYKKPDSAGEDGDFDGKVKAIEHVDALLPSALQLEPDVAVVTADHSTPCLLKAHSWHPVPVLLHSRYCRPDGVTAFHELACAAGCLGRMCSKQLMPVMLANAGRLRKYGA